jgi:hypothetical protein
MTPVAEPRAERWTTPTYGSLQLTVAPVARASGPAGDVQPLLDLAVVMAESDDVEAILELATAAIPTLAACRCLGVRGPSDALPGDGDDTVAYPLRTTSLHHGFLVVAADQPLLPEEDRLLRAMPPWTKPTTRLMRKVSTRAMARIP